MTALQRNFFCTIALGLLLSCQSETTDIIKVDLSEKVRIPKYYVVGKNPDSILIDGIANEKSWRSAKFTDDFVDIEGEKKPKFSTKVKMLWDEKYLYVYAELSEPHIWGDLRKRDTVIFYNNDFEIFIDPSATTRNYGEIEINALGTVWDLHLDKPYWSGGTADDHWNLDELKSEVKIYGTLNDPTDEDSYWTVECAIPMEALTELKQKGQDYVPVEGEQWRINFSRVEWEYELINGQYRRKKLNGEYFPEHNWVWSSQGVINMHLPEKWGYLQFTEELHTDRTAFKLEEDAEIKLVIYELFRKIRFGSLKYLLNKAVYQSSMLEVCLKAKKIMKIIFLKTNMGFELLIDNPTTGGVFVINEEGLLKKIK